MRAYRWTMALGAVSGAACLAGPAIAQTATPDGFDASGTARLRLEAIDGQARAGFNEADKMLNLRTTLMAQQRDGPVRFVAELWDGRIYGDKRGTPVTTSGHSRAEPLLQIWAVGSLTCRMCLIDAGHYAAACSATLSR